jgi:hypothetical protein
VLCALFRTLIVDLALVSASEGASLLSRLQKRHTGTLSCDDGVTTAAVYLEKRPVMVSDSSDMSASAGDAWLDY